MALGHRSNKCTYFCNSSGDVPVRVMDNKSEENASEQTDISRGEFIMLE